MNKNRLLPIVLTIMLLVSSSAVAQTEGETATLQGLITEVGDGYLLIADETLGEVHVVLDEAITTYEGVAAIDSLVVGQYAFVTYNGIMTRSVPPQVTAIKVGVFVVQGTVGEILTNGYTVEGDTVLGTVLVHMGEGLASVYQGVPITLYYNGVMALSMPPQINAAYLVVPMLEGTISNWNETSFTLTDNEVESYTIAINADTRLSTLPSNGETVRVYYDGTLQQDNQARALEIAPNADTKALLVAN